jgi:hypothetical protein
MDFILRVIGAAPGSCWSTEPVRFETADTALRYAVALIERCRGSTGPRPRFLIDGTGEGEMTVEEIWAIGRLNSPARSGGADT